MPDNVTAMMWNQRNGPPWHGKGTSVEGLATAAECIRKAGLDWGVAKIPIRADDPGALPIPKQMITVRTDLALTDPKRLFGVVGNEYEPLQNWEAFGFFDRIVGHAAAIYETAGAIENGKRIWLLAKLPKRLHAAKDDVVDPYLLLANGHDGTLMVHIKFTPVRVVCQNTLAQALVGGEQHVAIRHNRRLRRSLDDAAGLLGLIEKTLNDSEAVWKRMASQQLAARDAANYFRAVFGGRPDEEEEDGAPSKRSTTSLREKAAGNFENSQNKHMGIAGTVWAAYNAAVWAIDWERDSKKDRVDDLCLGEGARLKQVAKKQAELLMNN